MNTPIFYISETSPFSMRVRLVCILTGQKYTEEAPPGGSGSEAMKAITPLGKIPVITIGEQVLIESLSLMEYVVEKAERSSLIPENPERRAAMRGLMIAHDLYALAAIWPAFLQLRTGKPDPTACLEAMHAADKQYNILSRFFGAGDFAIGDKLTLADLAMAPFARLLDMLYPPFGETSPFVAQPRLARWYEAIRGIPEISDVLGRFDAAVARAFGKAA